MTFTSRRFRAPILPPIEQRLPLRTVFILLLSGANLILIQWVIVREMTTLLLGTELIILLTSVIYFLGISIGYRLSGRIQGRWATLLGSATIVLHLTLPVTFRLLVAALSGGGAYWAAFLVLPLLIPFIGSMFYSIFLPQFVESRQATLGSLYVIELLGTIFGIGILFFTSSLGLEFIFVIYAAALIVILTCLNLKRRYLTLLIGFCVVWLGVFPTLSKWSNERWYQTLLDFPEGTQILYSGYSAYQKVDVLELPNGERALYLDGLEHFNGASGIQLNRIIGEVPALLVEPNASLVIGAGAMQTEQLIAAHGGQVTTVELDGTVADVGMQFFDAYNHMSTLTNRAVVVDDAKHFLANANERYDLIIGDTPAAFSIQPATLYSTPFYGLVAQHLTDEGMFVGNMTSPFVPGNTLARRIAASLLDVFNEVMIVTPASVGWSFAFAGDHLPFTRAELEDAVRRNGEMQFTVFETEAVRQITGDAAPITLDSMDFVLQTSANWIQRRLNWGQP